MRCVPIGGFCKFDKFSVEQIVSVCHYFNTFKHVVVASCTRLYNQYPLRNRDKIGMIKFKGDAKSCGLLSAVVFVAIVE